MTQILTPEQYKNLSKKPKRKYKKTNNNPDQLKQEITMRTETKGKVTNYRFVKPCKTKDK